jgi:uncharacterized protein (DUF1330 family)
MPVYLVAALEKTDADGYAEYVRTAKISLEPYPEARLAADDAPRLVEGGLPAPRMILLQFESEAQFDEWYHSAAYQAAIPHRLGASDMAFMTLLKGH